MAKQPGQRQKATKPGGARTTGKRENKLKGQGMLSPERIEAYLDRLTNNVYFNAAYYLTLGVLAFAAVLLIVLYIGMHFAHPTIHSCDVYIPYKFQALSGVFKSFSDFISTNGWGSFFEAFYNFYVSEGTPKDSELIGKNVLMCGGGYIPLFLERARKMGVNIYLLDDGKRLNPDNIKLVQQFINVPEFPRVAIMEPQKIIDLVKGLNMKFDGVITITEDMGPLVARLSSALGLPGHSPQAADIARSKVELRRVLEEPLKSKGFYTPKYHAVTGLEDCDVITETIGYPVFLKPVFGVAAFFASRVDTAAECKEKASIYWSTMDPHVHPIYNYGRQLIAEELLSGYEIQIEFGLLNGSSVFHAFSSQYAIDRSYLVYPVNLTETEKARVVELCETTIKGIGLSSGMVHIELFYNPAKGPILIELNNRLSRGFLMMRHWHQALFGEPLVDYYNAVLHFATGTKPYVSVRSRPPVSLAIFPDNPSGAGWETSGKCALYLGKNAADSLALGLGDEQRVKHLASGSL